MDDVEVKVEVELGSVQVDSRQSLICCGWGLAEQCE